MTTRELIYALHAADPGGGRQWRCHCPAEDRDFVITDAVAHFDGATLYIEAETILNGEG